MISQHAGINFLRLAELLAFVALALSYINQGHDLRMFVLSNQLAPLIFR